MTAREKELAARVLFLEQQCTVFFNRWRAAADVAAALALILKQNQDPNRPPP